MKRKNLEEMKEFFKKQETNETKQMKQKTNAKKLIQLLCNFFFGTVKVGQYSGNVKSCTWARLAFTYNTIKKQKEIRNIHSEFFVSVRIK